MAVTTHSPLSYYRGLSLRQLGNENQAKALFEELKAHAEARLGEHAAIDYFATSLPNLLVFDEDFQARQNAGNQLLIALACHGLGDLEGAESALEKSLAFTNAEFHATGLAAALARN